MEKNLVIDLCATCPRYEDCPGSYSADRLCDCAPGGYLFIVSPEDVED